MIADFRFLWQNRERPKNWKRWLVVWGKRTRYSVCTFKLLSEPSILRWRGAKVDHLVVLGASEISGPSRNLAIGQETSLGRCRIALHDRVSIGSRVVINDGVEILTASHSLSDPRWGHKKAPITIGDYAWVATNAVILPGVTLGRGCVVGAGAVVRDDVPDYGVVIGNPAVLTEIKRCSDLCYSPVLLIAPFEAWVGKAHCHE